MAADPESFEREALVHMPALYRTARRLTGNDKDAEDLVQETFLRAFRFWNQFEQGTNARAWLFKILHNVHINTYHQKTRNVAQVSLDGTEEFFLYNHLAEGEKQSDLNPEEEVLSRIWDTEVLEALEKLPHDFKVVVLLADVEEFSYKEIAEIVGCPIGTVRSRLARGRRALQRLLWDYMQKRESIPG
ncbi:MAG: sigma-70 family RNA polymerase sigma factor [Candidatus Xenobia bacterium]